MKKLIVVFALLFALIVSGCGATSNGLSGSKPPNVHVEINGESYKAVLGSYCWDDSKGTAECVDTGGPVELLKDEEPIQVKAGAEIKLTMDYTPKPNKIHFTRIIEDGEELEVVIHDNQFTAPTEKGTYFYSYGVWWMDEDDENLSHGDAFYAFAVEVQ